ncbi:Uncharacterised protein [Mycobacteroides abscessus subsp. abscessus]|nr:Uncharacterised protein [Mycobacteroides abscessus subsp. abscessus]
MTEPSQAMSEAELRESVSDFIDQLSEDTGVDLDLDEVWSHLMTRKVEP